MQKRVPTWIIAANRPCIQSDARSVCVLNCMSAAGLSHCLPPESIWRSLSALCFRWCDRNWRLFHQWPVSFLYRFFYTMKNSFSCSMYLQNVNIPQIILGAKSQLLFTIHPPAIPLCMIRSTTESFVSTKE